MSVFRYTTRCQSSDAGLCCLRTPARQDQDTEGQSPSICGFIPGTTLARGAGRIYSGGVLPVYKNECQSICRECERPARTRGLCNSHYSKARLLGSISVRRHIHPPTTDVLTRHLRQLLHGINHRCSDSRSVAYHRYGGRGIKNYLTVEDLRYLWERDSAETMQRPSVDRICNDGNYTLANCRFLELTENTILAVSKPWCRDCQRPGDFGQRRICPECKTIRHDQPRPCKVCTIPFVRKGSKTICDSCRLRSGPCDACGALVTIDIKRGGAAARYKHRFCNKKCQGTWLGKHYGTGRPRPRAFVS
jgi:hypothetical protein